MPLFKKSNPKKNLGKIKCKICPNCKGCKTHKKKKYIESPPTPAPTPTPTPAPQPISRPTPGGLLTLTRRNQSGSGMATGYMSGALGGTVSIYEYTDPLGKYFYKGVLRLSRPGGTQDSLIFTTPNATIVTRAPITLIDTTGRHQLNVAQLNTEPFSYDYSYFY